MQVAESAHRHVGNTEDAAYAHILERVSVGFGARTMGQPVFTTDATDLWDVYLSAFIDPEERQHHNCNACRQFIERYGPLATIGELGFLESAVWDQMDAGPGRNPYVSAFTRMRMRVNEARVTGVFYAGEHILGTPETGHWVHLHAVNPEPFSYALKTPFQAMAEKKEDYRNMCRALSEFTPRMVQMAVDVLESDTLYRSEKVLGPAKWLHELHLARAAVTSRDGRMRDNVTWLAVASAPPGFCHPRTSMIGTLLEDIAAAKSFADVSRSFAAKMRADQYQRPQAAPAAGSIKQAEDAFEKMGLACSLQRRFARLDEVRALWTPRALKEQPNDSSRLFGHIEPKGALPDRAAGMMLPATTMTWDKFQRTVLPEALALDFYVPSHGNFCALLTAVHEDAPPVLQWDREEARNPVSHYLYMNGSAASRWGLRGGGFTKVTAVCLKPHMWSGVMNYEHQGKGVVFLLDGAVDSTEAGNALFPETLRSELHQFRAVIEAYSRTATLAGREQASACGYMLSHTERWNQRVRVTTAAGVREYSLDRWD